MVFVTGDCHGEIDRFLPEQFPQIKELTRSDSIIIAGDFGFLWTGDEEDQRILDQIEALGPMILFVDGNHENFDLLSEYPVEEWRGGSVHVLRPHILHLMRGQMYTIEGKRFFTFGGAKSTDKMYRRKGVSWWEEELANADEMMAGAATMEKNGWECNYIITHCAPEKIRLSLGGDYEGDYLTAYLEQIWRNCRYDAWFCGHYHMDRMVNEKFCILYEEIKRIL